MTETAFKPENYHGHPRFYELLNSIADLHSRKNHDYSGQDPLSNLKVSEEIDIPAWKGILVRLMDKWGRLKQFARSGNLEVKDESVIDTLMDNAVYSLLCIILYEEDAAEGEADRLVELGKQSCATCKWEEESCPQTDAGWCREYEKKEKKGHESCDNCEYLAKCDTPPDCRWCPSYRKRGS